MVAVLIFGATLLGIIVLFRVGKEGDLIPGLGMNGPDISTMHAIVSHTQEWLISLLF